MGLFSRSKNRVDGTAQIVACSGPPYNAMIGPCHLQLVVQTPGIEPFAAERSRVLRSSRWSRPGLTLPVRIDPSNPEGFDIQWRAVPNSQEAARDLAEQMAAAMRAQGELGGGAVGSGPVVRTARGVNAQVIGPGAGDPKRVEEGLRRAEAALGMDLGGDGLIGAPTAGETPEAGATGAGGSEAPPESGDDVITQLERLASLRERGLLTEEEFVGQKARLLET